MIKKHKKSKEKVAVRPMPVPSKKSDLGECLRIIRDMGEEGVRKIKHSYMRLFCEQARDKIEEIPDNEKAIHQDMNFVKLVVELQPKLNEVKGIASAAQVYGHAKALDDALIRINRIEDSDKALTLIVEIMKFNANFDTQEEKKA